VSILVAKEKSGRSPTKNPESRKGSLASLGHLSSVDDAPSVMGSLAADSRLESVQQRLTQYEEELRILRTAKGNADVEIVELQMLLRASEERLLRERDAFSSRLGRLLVEGFSSFRKTLLLLPALVQFLWHHHRHAGKAASPVELQRAVSLQAKAVADALAELKKSDAQTAAAWARSANFEPPLLARILMEIARAVRRTDPQTTVALGKEAIALAPSEQRSKWLAFAIADTGAIHEPAELLHRVIDNGGVLNANELRRANELFALSRIAQGKLSIPGRKTIPHKAMDKRALLVAGRSLPFHWNASTMRLHATALALAEGGWTAQVVTLPGYPGKATEDDESKAAGSVVSGVTYHRLPAKSSSEMIDLYVGEAADAIAALAVKIGASVIHASADTLSAYAGTIAAHLAGLPLVLDFAERVPEVQPLNPEARQSERFALYDKTQLMLAAEADAVLARTYSLHDVLVANGVAAENAVRLGDIGLVVEDGRERAVSWTPPGFAHGGRFVLGYIGDANEEVDLESLVGILADVVKQGVDAALVLAGVGRRFEAVQTLGRQQGLADRITVLPRPRLNVLKDHYALLNAVVLPYRSHGWRAPFEIVEAMAHGVCIVSNDDADTRAILGGHGVLTSPDKFAESIIGLSRDDNRRHALATGSQARARDLFGSKRLGSELTAVYEQAHARISSRDTKFRVLDGKANNPAPLVFGSTLQS
jgi:glycosyltransferase involved in cell wall biosynthesis